MCCTLWKLTEFFFEQSRLYLGLGRDGLLPPIFAKVHRMRHTPMNAQIWVGVVASVMAGLFNVHVLSHILSVGTLVWCCLIFLPWVLFSVHHYVLGLDIYLSKSLFYTNTSYSRFQLAFSSPIEFQRYQGNEML